MSELHRREQDEATRTPAWLPVLGIALFFILAIYLLASARTHVDATVQVPSSGEADPGAADGG